VSGPHSSSFAPLAPDAGPAPDLVLEPEVLDPVAPDDASGALARVARPGDPKTIKQWGKPFSKGVSGNPGGRMKAKGLSKYLKRAFGADGERLVEVLKSLALDPHKDAKVRLAAVELALAYMRGKPVQQVDHSAEGGPVRFCLVVERPDPDGDTP